MSEESAQSRVSASHRVVDPSVFSQKISQAVSEIRLASARGPGSSRDQVDIARDAITLRAHIAGVSQPAAATHPGWRGAIAGRIKVQVRRLIYWYVDPVFDVQQNNAVLMSEQLVSQARIIDDLRDQVTELQESLADLRRVNGQLQKAFRSTNRKLMTSVEPSTERHTDGEFRR